VAVDRVKALDGVKISMCCYKIRSRLEAAIAKPEKNVCQPGPLRFPILGQLLLGDRLARYIATSAGTRIYGWEPLRDSIKHCVALYDLPPLATKLEAFVYRAIRPLRWFLTCSSKDIRCGRDCGSRGRRTHHYSPATATPLRHVHHNRTAVILPALTGPQEPHPTES